MSSNLDPSLQKYVSPESWASLNALMTPEFTANLNSLFSNGPLFSGPLNIAPSLEDMGVKVTPYDPSMGPMVVKGPYNVYDFLENLSKPLVIPPVGMQVLEGLENQWLNAGINPKLGGMYRSNELLSILQNNDIKDLYKLKLKTGDDSTLPQLEYEGRMLGGLGRGEFVLPTDYIQQIAPNTYTIATSTAGSDVGVNYNAYFDDQGNLKTVLPQYFQKSEDSFLSDILPVLSILAMPFTGGLSAALGGGAATLGSTIAANALIQGGLGGLGSLASGGDFLEGALKGGATGAFTAGIGSLVNPIASSIGADVFNATDSKFLSDIVSGAVKGVPGALMSGDASNLLTGAVTGAVGSQVGDQLGLTPKQSQVAMGIASKLLQGGDLSPSDIFRIGTSFGGKTPTASETAVGGGAETSGMFDPDVETGLLYYGSDPDQEKYIDEDRLLARYPAPTVEDVRTTMSPMELNKFLEANIEDPGTIEALMQEYFPELYRQQIEVVGNRPAAELFPEFDQPLLTAEPTTPAPSPAPAPAPTPAPAPVSSPTPSPAPKAQSGMDMSGLFALLGMMNQGREKPDPYQVAQINARSPFGTIYDQQQDLLGMIGRG